MILNLQLVHKITKLVSISFTHYILQYNPVKFFNYVKFVNLINFVEDINLNISNLKLATLKYTVLNTVKEFIEFGFPNINEVLDPNVKEYFRLKNDLSV